MLTCALIASIQNVATAVENIEAEQFNGTALGSSTESIIAIKRSAELQQRSSAKRRIRSDSDHALYIGVKSPRTHIAINRKY